MLDDSCFICGFEKEHALEEHHLIPRRYSGSDTEANMVTVCSNCHRALESLYNDQFFARIVDLIDEQNGLPNSVKGRTPTGLRRGDDDEPAFMPNHDDNFKEAVAAVKLRDRGETLIEIQDRTGIPSSTISELYNKHYRKYQPFFAFVTIRQDEIVIDA